MPKYNGIHWMSEEEYQKALGQLRLQLGEVLSVFNMYGQGVHIPPAIEEISRLAEDFSLRIRGVDKPISLERVRKKRK